MKSKKKKRKKKNATLLDPKHRTEFGAITAQESKERSLKRGKPKREKCSFYTESLSKCLAGLN